MKKVFYILLLIAIGVACSKNKESNDQTAKGYFILSQVAPLKSLKSTENGTFDLGSIRKSTEFYFLLTNGGSTPVFDIQLGFSNGTFTVNPSTVASLDVAKNVSVSPILKIGALHGTLIDGIGYASLLKSGINDNVLTISGKTLSGKDTIRVSQSFNMKVNALVADFNIQNDSGLMDLTKYNTYYGYMTFKDSAKNSGLDVIRAYNYYDNNIKITNTGNVSLRFSIFNRQDLNYYTPQVYSKNFTLKPGEVSEYLNLPKCAGNNYAFEVCLKIYCEGTICDINKLQAGTDGNIYLVLMTQAK